MEKLLNEENTWDNATTCENAEGPCELIRRDEILIALRKKKHSERRKCCMLAVVRWSQKFSPHRRTPSRGRRN